MISYYIFKILKMLVFTNKVNGKMILLEKSVTCYSYPHPNLYLLFGI